MPAPAFRTEITIQIASELASTAPRAPSTINHLSSANPTFCGGSSGRKGGAGAGPAEEGALLGLAASNGPRHALRHVRPLRAVEQLDLVPARAQFLNGRVERLALVVGSDHEPHDDTLKGCAALGGPRSEAGRGSTILAADFTPLPR